MVGLFILGMMGAWIALAVFLGMKAPQWLNLSSRHQTAARIFLVPLLIFLPIMDEVIAYPQVKLMCKSTHDYKLMPNISRDKAHGKNVYFNIRESKIKNIFPSTIEATLYEGGYFDHETNELILYARSIGVKRGWLGMPAGSSGTKMTILLKGCSRSTKTKESSKSYTPRRGPALLHELDMKKIPLSDDKPFNHPLRTNP